MGSPLATRRGDLPKFEGEELVVVTSPMFPHRIGKGYDNPFTKIVKDVNGVADQEPSSLRGGAARLEGEIHDDPLRRQGFGNDRLQPSGSPQGHRRDPLGQRHSRAGIRGLDGGLVQKEVNSDRCMTSAWISAARAIATADALLIGAGAGMGVDSGLPDFRGKDGFWRAYPPYQRLGLDFVTLANPRWFAEDPTLAWGFYGHRMGLYRQTTPHEGFSILAPLGQVGTTRCDSSSRPMSTASFSAAGFDPDRIVEVHGSFDGMQCTRECGVGIFAGESFHVEIDAESMRAIHPLPVCPQCGALARPNILMFGDWGWDSARTDIQMQRLNHWIETLDDARLVVIECGAGQAVPTVRITCENIARRKRGILCADQSPRA